MKTWTSEYDELKEIVLKIVKNERQDIIDDIFHDCLIILLEHKKYKDLVEKDQVKYFFTRIVINQWRSSTSPTYKLYKKHKTIEMNEEITKTNDDYDYDRDILIERILNGLDNMLTSDIEKHRDMAILIIQYYSNGENFTKLSKIVGQDRSSLGKKFKRSINILKEDYMDESDIVFPKDLSKKIIESGLLKKDEPVNEDEVFEKYVLNNRVKFFNPQLFNHQEKVYITNYYNKKYKTNSKVGCGICFSNKVNHFVELYFESKK